MILPTAHVELERIIAAPVLQVYRAFTEPGLLTQWFAPSDGTPTTAEVDLRVGGRYRITMGRRTVAGTYLELAPPKRLAFTWIWQDEEPPSETIVTVDLEPCPQGTKIALRHDRLPAEVDCMGFEAGWTANLGRLQRLFQVPTPGGATSRGAPPSGDDPPRRGGERS